MNTKATTPDTAAPDGDDLLARLTSNAIAADANRMPHMAKCLRDARDALSNPRMGEAVADSDGLLAVLLARGRYVWKRDSDGSKIIAHGIVVDPLELQALTNPYLSNADFTELVAWRELSLACSLPGAVVWPNSWPQDVAVVAHLIWTLQTKLAAPPTAIPDGMVVECEWSFDGVMWNTTCGESWQFTTDGPAENNYRFCHGCGKPVVIAAAPGSAEVDHE